MGTSLEKRKRTRKRMVFDIIKKNNNLFSRNDLCKNAPYSMTAIAETVDELIREDMVTESESEEQRIGRPPVLLSINPQCRYYIGIECSSYSVNIEAINAMDESVYTNSRYLSRPKADDLLQEIRDILANFSQQFPEIWLHTPSVMVALPGKIDTENGVGISYDSIPDWKQINVRGYLNRYFSKKFLFMNNIDSMLIGYRFVNRLPEEDSVLFIMIRNGIGIRFLSHRTLLSNYEIVCEFEHAKAVNSNRICSCGKRGCYRAEITTQAIINKLKEYISVHDSELAQRFLPLSNEHEFILEFFNMVCEENPYAVEIFDECSFHIANLLSQALLVSSADTVVLSTEMCHLTQRFQNRLFYYLTQNRTPSLPRLDFVFPQNNFGAIGAAISAYQSELSDLNDY